jgi:hypothetical protein
LVWGKVPLMTLVTAMTMNRRGPLKGARHPAVELRVRAMGPEPWGAQVRRSAMQIRYPECLLLPKHLLLLVGFAIPLGFGRPVFSGRLFLRLPCPCATPPSLFRLPQGSSPGRTRRPSRAEMFAASARALSSREARTFSGSVLPAEEGSTHRPKGDPPSADTLAALHRSAPRRCVLRAPLGS